MRTHSCVLLLFLLEGVVIAGAHGSGGVLSRWSRQAVPCQPGDKACQKCSSSCSSIELSTLPECCEVYNACCDQYFQACKKCSSMVSHDVYFPEYCCASFTDCCHLVTTHSATIKEPEPVKPKSKPDLKIPTVAAPKPTTFPGSKNLVSQSPKAQIIQGPPTSGFSDFQDGAPPIPAAQTPAFQHQAPKAPVVQAQAPQAPAPRLAARGRDRSQRTFPQRTSSRKSGPDRTSTRRSNQRNSRPSQLNLRDREGRVTSRGRRV